MKDETEAGDSKGESETKWSVSDLEFPPDSTPQSLFCPICQELFQNPTIIKSCHHTFCAHCILQTVELEHKCPLCRSQISSPYSDLIPNQILKSVIGELRVFCPYRKNGCQSLQTVDSVLLHASNSCAYRHVSCKYAPLGCRFRGTSLAVAAHLEQTCAYEQLRPFIESTIDRMKVMEDRLGRQSKELERLREFVRTSKTNPLLILEDGGVEPSPGIPASLSSLSPSTRTQLSDSFNSGTVQTSLKWIERPLHCSQTIKEHRRGVTSLSLDSNCQKIFSGSYDGSVKVFSQSTGSFSLECSFSAHTSTVWANTLCNNDSLLVTGGSDSSLKIWNLKQLFDGNRSNATPQDLTITPVKTISDHRGKIYSLVNNERLLFSASSDDSVRVWNTQHDFDHVSILHGHQDNVNGLALDSSAGLITGSSDKTVKVWDVERMQCKITIEDIPSEVLDVAYGEGTILASTYDATIKVWDIRDPRTCKGTLIGHNWEVWQVEYVEGLVVSSSFDHSIRKWDMRMMSCLEVLTGHQGYVHALKLGREMLVSACADKTIKIWGA